MTGPDDQGWFTVALQLDKGRYEYKFVLDGHRWRTDPDNRLKTGPHDNAVLFVGVPGEPVSPTVVRPTPEVNMAARTQHPAEIGELSALLRTSPRHNPSEPCSAVEAWFGRHLMPVMHEASVTFVVCDPQATAAFVSIMGHGFWTAYDVPRLVPGSPMFAVSLKRDQIPKGAGYRLETESDGITRSIVDPHAWTVTSRAGEPVAVITRADPSRGRIELVRNVRPSSSQLRPRDLYVYLPPDYHSQSPRRYPVLYLHDGQNCWDDPTEPFGHGGWQVNLIADRLISAGKVEPFIAVGIPNTPDRAEEYGPGTNILSSTDHAYIQYLLRDVKPTIDRRYRTKPGPACTSLMGSSMGGIISLQIALLHPEVFGSAACLSPALWFADEAGQGYFDLLAKVGKVPVRIYLDSGTAEPGQDGAPDTRRMGQALLEAGWREGKELMRHEAIGAEHNERAWRTRLDKPLTFMFGR